MLFPQYCLSVFTKAPDLGRVKTRMQPVFSPELSLQLHCELVDFVLGEWNRANICPLNLLVAGSKKTFLKTFPQWQNLMITEQRGDNLGERLYCGLMSGLEHSRGVLLVGSDCPFIDKKYLVNVCEALALHDVVIGPASDGGYVLLALKHNYQALFCDIDWGGAEVFMQTIEKINQLSLTCHQLPVLPDIDRPQDLILLESIPRFHDLFTNYR